MIHFPKTSEEIQNALSGELYRMCAMDDILPTENQIKQVVEMCNEPEIYRWLFEEKLQGSPYPAELAQQWFSWGIEGWRNGTHFIFAVLDPQDNIVASLGIKNADLARGEVGYWASNKHRGIMANAVSRLLKLAKAAGFEKFYAQVQPANTKSMAVLERTGFLKTAELAELDGHLVYQRS